MANDVLPVLTQAPAPIKLFFLFLAAAVGLALVRTVRILPILRALRAARPDDVESVTRLMQVLHTRQRGPASDGLRRAEPIVRHALALVDYRIQATRRLLVFAAIVGALVSGLQAINDFDEVMILGVAQTPEAAIRRAVWLLVCRLGIMLGTSAIVYGMCMWLEAIRHRGAMAWSEACLTQKPRGGANDK